MEPAFGTDFGGVRVHADAESDALSRELSARAFTSGRDVFFRQGAYDPGSSGGQELLAHELTHVVQQRGDEVRRKLTLNTPGDRYEQEADQVARALVQEEHISHRRRPDGRRGQRQTDEEDETLPMQEKDELAHLKVEGVVQRGEPEESEFELKWFDEIGVPKSRVTGATDEDWQMWIDEYWNHRGSLPKSKVGQLHAEIDRFYFMAAESRMISPSEAEETGGGLLKRHRIPASESYRVPDSRGEMWLKIAALYVLGLELKSLRGTPIPLPEGLPSDVSLNSLLEILGWTRLGAQGVHSLLALLEGVGFLGAVTFITGLLAFGLAIFTGFAAAARAGAVNAIMAGIQSCCYSMTSWFYGDREKRPVSQHWEPVLNRELLDEKWDESWDDTKKAMDEWLDERIKELEKLAEEGKIPNVPTREQLHLLMREMTGGDAKAYCRMLMEHEATLDRVPDRQKKTIWPLVVELGYPL
jgi:hypothetical protein